MYSSSTPPYKKQQQQQQEKQQHHTCYRLKSVLGKWFDANEREQSGQTRRQRGFPATFQELQTK
jgi:hypothetical protein